MFNFRKSTTDSDLGRKPAKLNLKITDFAKQSAITIGQVLAAIDKVPAFHLQQLKEITYDPQRLMAKIINDPFADQHQKAKGVYIQAHRTIAIYSIDTRSLFLHTLFHELGHHVYFVVIGQSLKTRWVKQICRYDAFATDYAATNAAEDFAESYALYVLNPNELKAIPLKYAFMHQYVFKNSKTATAPESLDITI